MKPNFSGEFILDRKACSLSAHAAAMATARLSIAHDDPRFCCSARFATAGDAFEFSFERFTNGGEAVVTQHGTTRCYWDEDTLVSEDRLGSGDAAVVMTWRYELAAEGGRMRATERIRGGGRDQDNVWEFERQ